jgi:hypothetical protein
MSECPSPRHAPAAPNAAAAEEWVVTENEHREPSSTRWGSKASPGEPHSPRREPHSSRRESRSTRREPRSTPSPTTFPTRSTWIATSLFGGPQRRTPPPRTMPEVEAPRIAEGQIEVVDNEGPQIVTVDDGTTPLREQYRAPRRPRRAPDSKVDP